MTTPQRRVLELAILGLEAQRDRLEHELGELRRRLGTTSIQSTSTASRTSEQVPGKEPRFAPNKRKRMSAEQKRKIARTMKARWAKIRASTR